MTPEILISSPLPSTLSGISHHHSCGFGVTPALLSTFGSHLALSLLRLSSPPSLPWDWLDRFLRPHIYTGTNPYVPPLPSPQILLVPQTHENPVPLSKLYALAVCSVCSHLEYTLYSLGLLTHGMFENVHVREEELGKSLLSFPSLFSHVTRMIPSPLISLLPALPSPLSFFSFLLLSHRQRLILCICLVRA